MFHVCAWRFVSTRVSLSDKSIAILVALFLSACQPISRPHSTDLGSVSVYERVMQSGKIRCGYIIDPPGCRKDPNTKKLSGIGVETIELLGKNLGLKIEWAEELDWGSMIQGLETGRYDIIATPIWPNSARVRVADFTRPLYFSPVFAYAKKSSSLLRLSKLDMLNSPKYTIASIDGATPEVIAREDFPKARLLSLPQQCEISQLVLTVSSGKADATFVEPAVVAAYEKHNPGIIERIPSARPVRVFPDCWAIKRGQMEFKSMIDNALNQLINSGALDKLIDKYEPAPQTLFRISIPYRGTP